MRPDTSRTFHFLGIPSFSKRILFAIRQRIECHIRVFS
ncbi:Uncharacterised protein [Segatella copri]|nr:Uncharacterised protein [Segatella copri]